MIASEGVWFTIVYAVICLCIVAPSTEMVEFGLTLPQIFKKFLRDEKNSFVQHHLQRSALNTMAHSILPLGYVLGILSFGDNPNEQLARGNVWTALLLMAVLIVGNGFHKVLRWFFSDYEEHSAVKVLTVYASQRGETWKEVANRINAEFLLGRKFVTSGKINRTVLLQSWLVQIGPYDVQFIHTSDARLKVVASTEHRVSHIDATGLQCLAIQVESQRADVPSFVIQVNSSEYDQFRQRMPLENVKNIPIHRNLSDRFIETFKSMVACNPELEVTAAQEMCIGCMQEEADVALRKVCDDDNINHGTSRCTGCSCRPLWCSSCLARWFAARQDQDMPYTWLMGKCPCPTCRSTFCILDVRPLVIRGRGTTSSS